MRSQRDRRLRKVSKQIVKWTTEGAVKEMNRIFSILRRKAYVNCRGYDGILTKSANDWIAKQGGTARCVNSSRP